jgi:hypothetical protein
VADHLGFECRNGAVVRAPDGTKVAFVRLGLGIRFVNVDGSVSIGSPVVPTMNFQSGRRLVAEWAKACLSAGRRELHLYV